MIVPLPSIRDYSQTDKGIIIRARVYEEFAPTISAVYGRIEDSGKGTLRLDKEEIKRWLLRVFRERLDVHLNNTSENFFAAGVDSLRAARMLNIIKTEVFLNRKNPSTNIVYDTQNVEQLASYLHNLQTGTAIASRQDKQVFDMTQMTDMIQKYSKFDKYVDEGSPSEFQSVLLIGAIGFLGSFVLAQLLRTQSVVRIYCPVRAASPKEARGRLLSFLSSCRFPDDYRHDLDRIHALHIDSVLDIAPSLSEQESNYTRLTHIIHCAWPVNFNIPLSTFEDHISSLHRLLQLSLSSRNPHPAHFLFCSSASTASNCASPVPEAPMASLTSAANTGYGRSKLVAEKIIQQAVGSVEAKASILRIGQIIGDTLHHAKWTDSDAVPLMIRSALTTSALPALNERCAWLPVDTVAKCVLEIAGLGDADHAEREPNHHHNGDDDPSRPLSPSHVYNLVNPHTFAWTTDFLPALSATGLRFETLAPGSWLQRLRDHGGREVERGPWVKLMAFWEEKVERSSAGDDRRGEDGRGGGQMFETAVARGRSPALRGAPDVLAEDYVQAMMAAWMEKWRVAV